MDTSDIIEPNAPRIRESQLDKKFRRLLTDFTFYSKVMFGVEMQYKQGLFGNCALVHDHTIGNFCRQSGKSTAVAALDTKWLAFGNQGAPVTIGAYAPTMSQSHEIMFQQVIAFMEHQPILADMIEQKKMFGYLKLNNDYEMRVFTANKESKVRGFRPTIIQLDESQDIGDTKYHADIMASGAASERIIGGRVYTGLELKVVETGTPGGRNHFYEDIQEGTIVQNMDDVRALNADEIAIIIQPWQESRIVTKARAERARARMSKNLFEQEYECIFNLDTGFAFDFHDIQAATRGHSTRDYEPVADGFYVAGIDLGRNRDHSVITVLRWRNPHFQMVEHIEYPLDVRWVEQIIDPMIAVLARWQPGLTYVDKGHVGDLAFEHHFEPIPFYVEPFTYSTKSKAELVFNGQKYFQEQRLHLWDDVSLIEQLRKIPEDRSKSSIPIYDKPDDVSDDRVQSLLLALWAGRNYFGLDDHMSEQEALEGRKMAYKPREHLQSAFAPAEKMASENAVSVGNKLSRWDNKNPMGWYD